MGDVNVPRGIDQIEEVLLHISRRAVHPGGRELDRDHPAPGPCRLAVIDAGNGTELADP